MHRPALGFSLVLALASAAGCDLAYTLPVDRTDPVEVSFDLGTIGTDCTDGDPNDDILYEQREDMGLTYCKISATWAGTILDMVAIRDAIAADLEAEGAPVGIDQVDITFTEIGVENVVVRLVKDGNTVAWPDMTYYSASCRVPDVAGVVTADWSAGGDGPGSPTVVFDEGNQQAFLDHLNAAYDAQETVDGNGDAEIEFVYDAAVIGDISGAALEIDFDLNTTGEGGASINSILGG